MVVGRSRRNRRLTPWFTMRLSSPASAARTTTSSGSPLDDAAGDADDVPDQAEVAEVAGREEQAVGGRMTAQQFEQLVGTLVEAVDLGAEMTLAGGQDVAHDAPTVEPVSDRLSERLVCGDGLVGGERSGSPPKAGHHCWNEQKPHRLARPGPEVARRAGPLDR